MLSVVEHVLGLLQGWMVWLLLGGLAAYSVWAEQRAGRRARLGLCNRCGRRPGLTAPTGSSLRMCDRCAALTNRNHRLGLYFLLGMSIFAAIAAVAGTLGDVLCGYPLSWQSALMLIGLVTMPVILGLFTRWVLAPQR